MTHEEIWQNESAESDVICVLDMADEDGGDAENGEDRENDDKMDARSDIEGQMQEREVEKAFANWRYCRCRQKK